MSDLFTVHEIEGAESGPRLLIVAGVHGDEYEGIEAIRRLIEKIKPANLKGTLTLIPVVNESAHALDKRTGEDGLDLARTCPGKPDGSLTERVAHDISNLIRASDAFIDLHTGGRAMQIDPLIGYMLVQDEEVLQRQRKMASDFGLPIIWGTSGNLNGRTLSVARDAGVPAIYGEYLGGEACSAKGVDDYFSGCLRVLASMSMIPNAPELESEPELGIEDEREGSGHLQVCHPSPVEGTFTSNVQLAQVVKTGQDIGRVNDVIVSAEKSGRLICLHLNGNVKKEESLAVILELKPNE